MDRNLSSQGCLGPVGARPAGAVLAHDTIEFVALTNQGAAVFFEPDPGLLIILRGLRDHIRREWGTRRSYNSWPRPPAPRKPGSGSEKEHVAFRAKIPAGR